MKLLHFPLHSFVYIKYMLQDSPPTNFYLQKRPPTDFLTRVPLWSSVELAGSTQGFGTIFVVTDVGVFAMELESGDVRKVGKPRKHLTIFPFMSFFTPGIVLATLLRCNPALYFCTFA